MTHRTITSSLIVAIGLLLSVAASAVQDIKPIAFFPGTITFLKIAPADKVELKWTEPNTEDYNNILGEGEIWVIISVQLKDGRSIGRFDYSLNDTKCMGLRLDEDVAFDCNLLEVDAKTSKSVQLLYKVDATEKFNFDLTYAMNSLPLEYRAIAIDVSDPAPVVEAAAEGDDAPAEAVAMPDGFAFAWIKEKREGDVNLTEVIDGTVTLEEKGDYVILKSGDDAITSVTGLGLEVKRDGDAMMWTPAPVALYRTGTLVGVYDPATDAVTAGGNAPKTLEAPEAAAEAADPEPEAEPVAEVKAVKDPEPVAKPKEDPKPKEKEKEKPKTDAGGGWGF